MQAPRFERFLQEIFGDRTDEERTALIAFLQRALGYGITGNVSSIYSCSSTAKRGATAKTH